MMTIHKYNLKPKYSKQWEKYKLIQNYHKQANYKQNITVRQRHLWSRIDQKLSGSLVQNITLYFLFQRGGFLGRPEFRDPSPMQRRVEGEGQDMEEEEEDKEDTDAMKEDEEEEEEEEEEEVVEEETTMNNHNDNNNSNHTEEKVRDIWI